MKTKLNAAQTILARTYANGEFSYVKTTQEAEDIGDGLFSFLMYELSDSEDCTDLETAIQRVDTAIEQLLTVRAKLEEAYFTS